MRFLRVWLAFLRLLLFVSLVTALTSVPGWLVVRATDSLWLALGTSALVVSVFWTWVIVSPWSQTLAGRLLAALSPPSEERRSQRE